MTTKESITRDLEEMKAKGYGGVSRKAMEYMIKEGLFQSSRDLLLTIEI